MLRQFASAGRRRVAVALGQVRDRADQMRVALVGPAADAPGARTYAHLWRPASVREAAFQIYNTRDMASFEEGGRLDFDWLEPALGRERSVLDLGCGIGRVAYYVAPACKTLWAVDVSPHMLGLARERLSPFANVRFALCRDVTVPDVPSASVDLAYSLLVLQHVEREDAFLLLEELRRVIRPGGTVMLTFPNLLSDVYLEGFLRYAHQRESFQLHRARVYTPQEVERLVGAAGFETAVLDAGTEIRVTARRP